MNKPLPIGVDRPAPIKFMSRWSAGSLFSPFFLLAITSSCVLLLSAAVYILRTVKTLEVSVSPSAESIVQRTGVVKTMSDKAAIQWAQMTVQLMESWSNDTLATQAQRVQPIIHPRYRASISEDYDILKKQVRDLWFSRAVTAGEAVVISNANGHYVIQVAYEQFDYSGSKRSGRVAVSPSDWVMQIEVIQDLPNDDNISGMLIIGRTRTDRDTWIKSGRYDFWKHLRGVK